MRADGLDRRIDDSKWGEKPFYYCKGRLYFSRQIERRLFFFLTIAMLLWGILEKIGLS